MLFFSLLVFTFERLVAVILFVANLTMNEW